MFFTDEFYTLTFSTDFLYVRFIGDRSIDEKDFGKIQKDKSIGNE
jgi:hypothetical protein